MYQRLLNGQSKMCIVINIHNSLFHCTITLWDTICTSYLPACHESVLQGIPRSLYIWTVSWLLKRQIKSSYQKSVSWRASYRQWCECPIICVIAIPDICYPTIQCLSYSISWGIIALPKVIPSECMHQDTMHEFTVCGPISCMKYVF